jgi:hypothetical protein
MTQIATRAIALQEAVKAAGTSGAETILEIAGLFHDFIIAGEQAAAPAVSKPTAEPKPPKAAAAVKPPKAEPKPAPKTDMDEVDPKGEPDTVGNVVSRLIKGGKRDAAVALLKKYKATSVSGVKEADQAAFISEGLDELLAS